jgi:hypothetical protein
VFAAERLLTAVWHYLPHVMTSITASPPATKRRARIPRKTRFDFWFDLVMLIAFTLDYSFRFTGLAVHEWVGLLFIVVIPVHVVQHWDWVVRTTKRIVRRKPGRDTLRWVVDLLLMPSMVLCVAAGVLISQSALPAIGLHPFRDPFWTGLHTTTADVTVFLVAVHVALSWRWALSLIKRVFRRGASA